MSQSNTTAADVEALHANVQPSREDESWFVAQLHPDDAPVPSSFLESVEREVSYYRQFPSPIAQFVADRLAEICQLIVWTDARNPSDYVERLEIADDDRRATWFDRGYSQGAEDARRELAAYYHRPGPEDRS
jgi:hypothetical protein